MVVAILNDPSEVNVAGPTQEHFRALCRAVLRDILVAWEREQVAACVYVWNDYMVHHCSWVEFQWRKVHRRDGCLAADTAFQAAFVSNW